jgi:hypothetical protein
MRGTAAALAAALLAGCGGGGEGGGSGTSLEVSPASLTFQAEQDGPLPAAQNVVATFRGDGVIAGYPAGTEVPEWLALEAGPGSGASQTFVVRVVSTQLPLGEHATTVRIITGKVDGTQLVVRDVPIRCVVGPPADRTVTLSATSLSFSSHEGLAPAPQTFQVSSAFLPASFTAAVHWRNGPVDWLPAPAPFRLAQGPGAVTVQPLGRPRGSYAADVVILDEMGRERARLPVSYEVAPAYAVDGPVFPVVTHAATRADLERTFAISTGVDAATGARYRWSLASSEPWVSVTPAEGDLSADVPVVVRLDPDALWDLPNGARSALLTLTFTQGGAVSAYLSVSVDLELAPALVVPETVELSVGRTTDASGLSRSVAVASNLGEAFAAHGGAWTATEGAPWLAASASGATGGSLTVEALPGAFPALANGVHSATIALQAASPRVAGTSLEARLALALPAVERVAPYATWVGRTDEVSLRGSGFGAAGPVPVSFGAAVAEGRVVSDAEIRVSPPADAVVATGTVPVAIGNGLGIDRGAAELKVLSAPAYAAGTVPLGIGKGYSRMVLDPERSAVILTAEWGGTDVRRVRFADGAWSTDAYPLADATGAGVAADGQTILATAGTTGTPELFVELDPESLALRGSTAYADAYGTFDIVAPLADGRTLIVDSEQWAETLWYPSMAAGPYALVHHPFALLPRDRSRLILRGTSAGQDTLVLEAGGAAFSTRVVSATSSSPSLWSVSGDAGRLLAHTRLYDGAFSYLGQLAVPDVELGAVALSPDGRFAYTVGRAGAGQPWFFRRTDVSVAGPYAAEEPALALSVPAAEYVHLLRVSEDGGTLFALALAASGTETIFHALPLP